MTVCVIKPLFSTFGVGAEAHLYFLAPSDFK